MRIIARRNMAVVFVAAMICANAQGQDQAAYERRSIERHIDMFNWLDRDRDGAVSLLEAQGDVNFTPVFADIDINRDGLVTKAELDRYLQLQYRMPPA